MAMNKKVVALFALGILIPGTTSARPTLNTMVGRSLRTAYSKGKAGAGFLYNKVPQAAKETISDALDFNRAEGAYTTFPTVGAIDNKHAFVASVLSAAGATAFLDDNNSNSEIASSALFSALGTAFALKKMSEHQGDTINRNITALVAYLLGQNGNQVFSFIKDAFYSKNPVTAIKELFAKRRTQGETRALFVRNFGPLVALKFTPATPYTFAVMDPFAEALRAENTPMPAAATQRDRTSFWMGESAVSGTWVPLRTEDDQFN